MSSSARGTTCKGGKQNSAGSFTASPGNPRDRRKGHKSNEGGYEAENESHANTDNVCLRMPITEHFRCMGLLIYQ
jgi:hypothetical protein